MNYFITRDDMRTKFDRALKAGGDLYDFDDIMERVKDGRMQSFVQGDTWIITQVNEFPKARVLEITFVVGFIEDAIDALPQILNFARTIGATRLTALGRDGWGHHARAHVQLGWKKVGTLFARNLT